MAKKPQAPATIPPTAALVMFWDGTAVADGDEVTVCDEDTVVDEEEKEVLDCVVVALVVEVDVDAVINWTTSWLVGWVAAQPNCLDPPGNRNVSQ